MKKLLKVFSLIIVLSLLCTNLIVINNAASESNSDVGSPVLVKNTTQWTVDKNIDFASYKFKGSGCDLIEYFTKDDSEYKNYSITYEEKTSENNTAERDEETFKNLLNVMANYSIDNTNEKIKIVYETIEVRLLADCTSVSGPEGTSFDLSFTTNLPIRFNIKICKNKYNKFYNDDNYYKLDEIVPEVGRDAGTYTKKIKLTIPYVDKHSIKYYINFSLFNDDKNSTISSIPLTITENHDDKPFHIYFVGEWNLLPEGYADRLYDMFYSTYPLLYKRWAPDNAPKDIVFQALNKDGDTSWNNGGANVTVCIPFAMEDLNSIGYFSHELTHAVQKYKSDCPTLVYPDKSSLEWWQENFASYGGFRYFHWMDKKYIQEMNYADMAKVSNESIYFDWLGNTQWFFAWMDYYYPTSKDEDGKIVYGLIDTVNNALNDGTYTDQIFNNITGCSMFELMKKYTKDVNENGWRFTGFKDYSDNWLVEDIDGLENPTYPTLTPTDVPLKDYLNQPTSGNNNDNDNVANLFDNNSNTKYSTKSAEQCVEFSMKQPVTVKSYKITTCGKTSLDPKSWKLYGSEDRSEWKLIDNVKDSTRTMEADDLKTYRYTTNNMISYKYYKFEMTSKDDSFIKLSDISFYDTSLMNMFDKVIKATDGDKSTHGAEKLFDNKLSTKYCTEESKPYVIFSMKKPVTVKYYYIATGNDTSEYTGRNPESWTLYGSNDGVSWDTKIDRVKKGSTILEAVDKKYYRFDTNNTESFKYYKLQINSCYSDSTVQLSEFSLCGDAE